MSSLSASQKQQVADWIKDGATLSEVQKKITSEFSVHMTYLDVRFLVDDLDVTPVDKTPPPAPVKTEPEPQAAGEPTPAGAESRAAPSGSVRINIDPIQPPGVLVGGTVTFSDGKTGRWQMDQQGQLGFVPPEPGYKPTPADVQQFQLGLDAELRKLGY